MWQVVQHQQQTTTTSFHTRRPLGLCNAPVSVYNKQQQPAFTHAVLSVCAMHLFQCTTNNNNNQLSHTPSSRSVQCTCFSVQQTTTTTSFHTRRPLGLCNAPVSVYNKQQKQPAFTHAVLSVCAMHLFQCTTNGNNNNQLSHTQSLQPMRCTSFNVQVHAVADPQSVQPGTAACSNNDTRYN